MAEEHWRELATEEEKQTCPTCGLAKYWNDRAHPNYWKATSCTDPFHTEARKRAEAATKFGKDG